MKMESRKQAIDKIYKRRNRYEIPDYQREKVWGVPEKQLLVDSILKGWKLPKFYFLKTNDVTYEVVDGQQRLSAIFEFLDGELELSEESSSKFGGVSKYSDLDVDVSDRFDDFEINFDEIEDATDEEIQEFFKRLQGGYRLNGPERLNAVPGKLTAFCRSLAKHEFFKRGVSFRDKRYAYFDVAAKATAVEVEGLDAGMRIDELDPLFRSHMSFSAASQVGKRLQGSLNFLAEAFPTESKALRLRSFTQSIITLACKLQENGAAKDKHAQFRSFVEHFVDELARQVEAGHTATDVDYLTFQRTVSANAKGAARTRHQILLRKLFEFDPTFIEGFGADALAASGIDKAISSAQSQIVNLVSEINDIYSSKTGKDLFKATNKTSKSQMQIGSVCTDFEGYKALVESLYFLFWEGPGAKLDEKPDSFKLINTLRTDLQHDVDHGGDKKYKQKKLFAADAFMKLSGITSPQSTHPERFPVIQLKLLNMVRKDLLELRRAQETQ